MPENRVDRSTVHRSGSRDVGSRVGLQKGHDTYGATGELIRVSHDQVWVRWDGKEEEDGPLQANSLFVIN